MPIDKELLNAIKNNAQYLNFVNLTAYDLLEKDIKDLAEALRTNINVSHLFLDETKLNDQQIQPLVDILEQTFITNISLKGTNVSENLQIKIKTLTERNNSIKFQEMEISPKKEFTLPNNILIANSSKYSYEGFIAVFPKKDINPPLDDWKFHISVHIDDLPKAWNLLMKKHEFRNYSHPHKIIHPLRFVEYDALKIERAHSKVESLENKIIVILSNILQKKLGEFSSLKVTEQERSNLLSEIYKMHKLIREVNNDFENKKILKEENIKKADELLSTWIIDPQKPKEKLNVYDENSLSSYIKRIDFKSLDHQIMLRERLLFEAQITLYFDPKNLNNNFTSEKELANKINQWLSEANIRPGKLPMTDARLNTYVSVRNDSVNLHRDKSFYDFQDFNSVQTNPFFDEILNSWVSDSTFTALLKNSISKNTDASQKSSFLNLPLVERSKAFLNFLLNNKNPLSPEETANFKSLLEESLQPKLNNDDERNGLLYFLNVLHRATPDNKNNTTQLEKILAKNNNEPYAKDFVLKIKEIEKNINPILNLVDSKVTDPVAIFAKKINDALSKVESSSLKLQMLESAFDYLFMNKDLDFFKIKGHAGFSFLKPRKDHYPIDKQLQEYLKVMKDAYYEIVKAKKNDPEIRQMAKESRLVDFNRTRFQLFYKETTQTREKINKLTR